MAYLSAAEAAELAMEVGEVGQACYRLIAEGTRYPRMRALLMDMAQEEAAHCAAWAALCDGHANMPVRSEEEWQEYRSYVRAAARSVLPYAPDQVLVIAERARDERDVIGIAKELTESMTRFLGTLCGTVSLDGCQSITERIVSDQESRLQNLDKMLWSTSPGHGQAPRSQTGLRVALSAEERELSPAIPVMAGG
jgi:rubrerythrin